jgi:hypothetical protein
VLGVEILGGLAMLPYGLCLTMRVTNNDVPPPDEKGQVGDGPAHALPPRQPPALRAPALLSPQARG